MFRCIATAKLKHRRRVENESSRLYTSSMFEFTGGKRQRAECDWKTGRCSDNSDMRTHSLSMEEGRRRQLLSSLTDGVTKCDGKLGFLGDVEEVLISLGRNSHLSTDESGESLCYCNSCLT